MGQTLEKQRMDPPKGNSAKRRPVSVSEGNWRFGCVGVCQVLRRRRFGIKDAHPLFAVSEQKQYFNLIHAAGRMFDEETLPACQM